MTIPEQISLDISTLQTLYEENAITPEELILFLFEKINRLLHFNTWITLLDQQDVLSRANQLSKLPKAQQQALPLYGIPFAVKDNFDVAHLPTTAACPEYAYVPTTSATIVEKLVDAGALLIGKTNLDQFATGLVGTRSPYGACHNPFDEQYISGGSSSGSAVAVSQGLVSFSLGTDTAGSGRIPAGFNNIVGLKPTRGRLSIKGIVPACLSVDCASIFALTCEDAWHVFQIIEGEDPGDPYSRESRDSEGGKTFSTKTPSFRFGVPGPEQLKFFQNKEYEHLFDHAVKQLGKLGGEKQIIDYTPFQNAAELLYGGPWVAERYAAIQPLIEKKPETLHPATRKIIEGARNYLAVDAYRAFYQLQTYIKQAALAWDQMDILVLPTAGTIYTIEQVEKDPIQLNTNLGTYTNFVNLLDLCAWAVPSGFQKNGLPFGITMLAPAFQDRFLGNLAALYQHTAKTGMGTASRSLPQPRLPLASHGEADTMNLVVFGLHLAGQPLNHQLIELGGQLVRVGKTDPHYRIYVLDGGNGVKKPAVVRMNNGSGTAVELEIWEIPARNVGAFVRKIPPPLGIGTVNLEDGSQSKGFICEAEDSLKDAEDITEYGGWRAYLNRKTP